MDYIVTRADNPDELMHYGIKGMKWGVRRYVNNDGTLTKQGNIRANRAFNGETSVMSDPDSKITKNRRKVVNKYAKYKTEKQRQADEQYRKAENNYLTYVENYSKSNKDTQVRYEHDFDHTRKGKQLLKALYNSDKTRKMAYAGEKWFWKYARDLVNAEVKDHMNNR